MRRGKLILAAAAASALTGQMAFGVDYSWTNFAAGTYQWGTPANWSPAGTPNASTDTANISGVVTGGTLNIGLAADYTVNTLTSGDTAGVQLVDIGDSNSGGGALVLENGTASSTINLAGFTRFSAPLQLGSTVAGPGAGGTPVQATNFRVDGVSGAQFLAPIRVFTDNNAGDGSIVQRRILILNSGSTTANGGTFLLKDIVLSQPGAIQRGELQITHSGVNTTFPAAVGGTVVFDGDITAGAIAGSQLFVGFSGSASGTPIGLTRYEFNRTQSYTGATTLHKGNYVLKADQAFGTGQLNIQHAASSYGANLISDSDSRSLPNLIQLQNNLTVAGQNSLTFNGNVFQSNNREFTNLLPDGKVVTFNGFIAAAVGSDGGTETGRALTFDGPGDTIVNGPIYNHRNPWIASAVATDTLRDAAVEPNPFSQGFGGLGKKGTGVLTVNSTVLPTITDGTTSFTGPTSTLRGPTTVMGGLLQFASPAAYGKIDSYTGGSLVITNSPGTRRITVIPGGAIGVLDGTITDDFIAKLNDATLTGGNTGGLALAPADASKALDFSSGSLGTAQVSGMSVGAVQNGVVYLGTITPNPAQGYRLGGGGRLTLPNANALVGANNVTITNGGTVALTGSNSYTGKTTVRGDYIRTSEVQAARATPNTDNVLTAPYAIRVDATLEVNALANGGANSSIGASAASASNLELNGGTLRYLGGASASDRLFTVGPVGATLDASGTGALNLTNTGALVIADVGAVSAATLSTGGNSRLIQGLTGDVNSITPGMIVTATVAGVSTFLSATSEVQGIHPNFGFTGGSPYILNNQLIVSAGSAAAATNATLTFANQDRNLNLTGSNAGANTLAAQLTDSAAGQLAIVKSGSGAWNVTGANNTFTGGMTVNAGVLSVKKLVGNGTTTINGGTLRIGPGGPVGDTTSTSVFVEGGFSVAGGATPAGRLDVGKNGVVFDYTTTSPKATVAALLAAGRAGGAWTGNGIGSSDAAAASGTHAVGYAEASSIGSPATFLGQSVDATAVLVRYTRLGDANLSGGVTLDDFTALAGGFGAPGSEWSTGDFNYDGVVNLDDFTNLAANFGTVAAGEAARSAVPEPTALSLLAAGAVLLGRRRRA